MNGFFTFIVLVVSIFMLVWTASAEQKEQAAKVEQARTECVR